MTENVIIIGSGPAGWAAANLYSSCTIEPLVLEGALTEENRLQGTLPLGQLNLTTEVENYPGMQRVISKVILMEPSIKKSANIWLHIQNMVSVVLSSWS